VCPYFYNPEESGSILIMLIRKAKALNSKVSFGQVVQYEFYFSAPRTNNQKGNQKSHHNWAKQTYNSLAKYLLIGFVCCNPKSKAIIQNLFIFPY